MHPTALRANGTTRRLNWACGPTPAPGWINSDRLEAPGIDISCDIRNGLPVADDEFEYVVSIHGLQDLAYPDIVPTLRELRRVLEPSGVLRLGVPDLDRAIAAYMRGDRRYFYVPDGDASSLGAKLVTQITWYGSVRTPFTYDSLEEWLLAAGFRTVERCEYRRTTTRDPEIVRLDNRERESLFVEAMK